MIKKLTINKPKDSEHSIQVTLFQWAKLYEPKYPELKYMFAIPNGAKLPWAKNRKGQRWSPEAMRLIAEGLKSGCPDIFLPAARNNCHGLFIEMKSKDGKLSKNQAEFLTVLSQNGYETAVCNSFEQAKDTIINYLWGLQK